jgi:rhamnose utilization protein RhaD (predicted bifunctional aldolase and dehydrogenase)
MRLSKPEKERFSDFVELSRFAGARFDLVQAGGGNASTHFFSDRFSADCMLIKASGMRLSEVSQKAGWLLVDKKKILTMLERCEENASHNHLEACGEDCILERAGQGLKAGTAPAARAKRSEPSIETYLHALFTGFVLHTHPISLNALFSRVDWREKARALIVSEADLDIYLVNYRTPGIPLALEIRSVLKAAATLQKSPSLDSNPTVLRRDTDSAPGAKAALIHNHGLIVAASSVEKTIKITSDIVEVIAKSLPNQVDFSRYVFAERLSRLFSRDLVVYPSNDETILHWLHNHDAKQDNSPEPDPLEHPLCPDTIVYCGRQTLFFQTDEEDSWKREIVEFEKRNKHSARVVIAGRNIFFIANSLAQARNVEEVFSAHLLTLAAAGATGTSEKSEPRSTGRSQVVPNLDILSISEDEKANLLSWDAEKKRREM